MMKIQNNVSIYTEGICKNDIFLGSSMVFTNVINARCSYKKEYTQTIIGEFVLIGTGSIATQEIYNYALVVGNPARQIGWVSEYDHRLNFNNDNLAVCEESNQKYKLNNNQVTRVN